MSPVSGPLPTYLLPHGGRFPQQNTIDIELGLINPASYANENTPTSEGITTSPSCLLTIPLESKPKIYGCLLTNPIRNSLHEDHIIPKSPKHELWLEVFAQTPTSSFANGFANKRKPIIYLTHRHQEHQYKEEDKDIQTSRFLIEASWEKSPATRSAQDWTRTSSRSCY
ncbi:hypothetical protein HO173_006242 [Letharia columbiana]|uniref:Uncharacterized protein n=1 Tax=Letharia columbiana TaxID=112416 RepID=A0A8H6FVH5_9LECA|nr:uncharacterized protein HO173_006242 [Letharia columbiana]KAF6235559.1 hypothetical protein HO173_006242 [Letharia columbiana]